MFVLAAFVVALFGRYGKKMLKTATATVTHSVGGGRAIDVVTSFVSCARTQVVL
jgi:hypothetical protein